MRQIGLVMLVSLATVSCAQIPKGEDKQSAQLDGGSCYIDPKYVYDFTFEGNVAKINRHRLGDQKTIDKKVVSGKEIQVSCRSLLKTLKPDVPPFPPGAAGVVLKVDGKSVFFINADSAEPGKKLRKELSGAYDRP